MQLIIRDLIYRSPLKGTLALNEKQQLSDKTSEATARAKVLETYNNPSTTIYKMIELLESL